MTRLVVPIVLTATFMQLLDVTIAQVALPSIRQDLGAGQGALQLVLAGYTLTYACLLIVAARLGDRHGYRRLFIIGLSLFTLASALCAAAPSVSLLIGARLLQGVGSGLMAPQVLSLIQTAVPASRRAHTLGLLGATMAIASLTGPLLGGLLVEADLFGLGWRAIFLVNVPVSLLALAGSTLLPRTHASGQPRVDALGAVLIAVGLGLLILPLAVGPDIDWPLWTWLSLGSSAVVLALFVLSQRSGRDPLLHPSVIQNHTSRAGVLLVFVFNAGVPSFSYLLFLYLQIGAGHTPLQAALIAAPYAAMAIVGSRLSAPLAQRYGTLLLTAAAGSLAAVMMALYLVIDAAPWLTPPVLAVGGFSFGLFTASVFALVLARVEPAAIGSASGLLPTAQQLGGAIGITLASLTYLLGSSPASAFRSALIYETAVFLLAATLATKLSRTNNNRLHNPTPVA